MTSGLKKTYEKSSKYPDTGVPPQRREAWIKFLKDTIFGELDEMAARSGKPDQYKKRKISQIRETNKWSEFHNSTDLTIDQIGRYLDEEEVLVRDFHPEHQDKGWIDVLSNYTRKELDDFPLEIFNKIHLQPEFRPVAFLGTGGRAKSKKERNVTKTKKKKKAKKKKKSHKGGYDDVPKGVSRDQYKRLEESKKKKSKKNRCKECRCRPCKCREGIHCYHIRCPSCNNKRKKTHRGGYTEKYTKKSTQKGGFCPPCLIAPLITAAGLGSTAYAVSRSSSSKTVNGKTVSKRKESYEIKKDGKKIKKIYEQKNNKIYLNGKEIKPRSKDSNEATKRLNKRIKECIESGFKKC